MLLPIYQVYNGDGGRLTVVINNSVRYTIAGAAFLLQVSASTVRSWANGYTVKTRLKYERTRKLILSERQDEGLISFWELIELWYVKRLTERGCKLSDIELAVVHLQDKLGDYPLTKANLKSVGGQIVTEHYKDDLFTNTVTLQYLLEYASEMADSLDYDGEEAVTLYLTKDRKVRIDPRICFGVPVVSSGVPTRSIAQRYKIEGDMESTAEWFGLEPAEIEAAVDFETRWNQKAA